MVLISKAKKARKANIKKAQALNPFHPRQLRHQKSNKRQTKSGPSGPPVEPSTSNSNPKKIFYGIFFSIFVFRGNTQGVSLYGGFTVIKIFFKNAKKNFFAGDWTPDCKMIKPSHNHWAKHASNIITYFFNQVERVYLF